jgi:hypothetical protein
VTIWLATKQHGLDLRSDPRGKLLAGSLFKNDRKNSTNMNRSSKQFAIAMAVAAATITGLKADALSQGKQPPASSDPTKFSLSVNNGNSSGTYAAGTQVTVSAEVPKPGAKFTCWTGDVAILANPSLPTTTATIPFMAVTITANFAAPANSSPALGPTTPTKPATKSRPARGRIWEG